MRLISIFMILVAASCSSLWDGQVASNPSVCTEEMRLCLRRNMACPAPADVALAEATMACGADICNFSALPSNKYVQDGMKIPSNTMTYSLDFDGDGKSENQYKILAYGLTVIGINTQDVVNSDLSSGRQLNLINIQTLGLFDELCTRINILKNDSVLTPKFDGTDGFIAASAPTARLDATIRSGILYSLRPKEQVAMNEAILKIRIYLGLTSVDVDLHGAYMTGTLDLRSGVPAILNGAMYGIINKSDIDNVIIPAYAQNVTSEINANPQADSSKTLSSLFENMQNTVSNQKCMLAADCCATSPSTCRILPDEVRISPIGGALAPDLQAFDEAGNWKLVPGGKMKNGMSVGFGFTAIHASF